MESSSYNEDVFELVDNPDQGTDDARLLMTAAKGGSMGFIGSVGGKFLAFLFQILICRLYGPRVYGLFVTGVLICMILQYIAALGLQKGGMRFLSIAHDVQDCREMFGSINLSLILPLFTGSILAIVFYSIASLVAAECFHDEAMITVFRHFCFAIPFFAILEIGSDLSCAFKTTVYSSLIRHITFPILQMAFFSIFWFCGAGTLAAVDAFVCSVFLVALLMIVTVYRQAFAYQRQVCSTMPYSKFTFYRWRPVLMYSLPLMPFNLLLILAGFTDIIMLNILADTANIGEYAAAARWAMLCAMLISPLNLIFGPLMAGRHATHKIQEVRLLYGAITRWAFFLTLPAFLCLTVAGRSLMMVFGSEFALRGPQILAVLMVGTVFNALSTGAGLLLVMGHHQRRELALLTGSLIVNVVLNLLWIPRLGSLGAAVATTVSGGLTTVARIIVVRRCLNVFPLNKQFLVVGATAALLAVGGLIAFNRIASVGSQLIGATSCVLILLMIIMRIGLTADDRRILSTVRARLFNLHFPRRATKIARLSPHDVPSCTDNDNVLCPSGTRETTTGHDMHGEDRI